MTDAKLKSYADRIDRLEEEKKAIGGDVKDVYVEVKAAGYLPKALRKVLAERRKKTDAELEAEVERYRAALGMASYRDVSAALGVSKSKLHRLVPRKTNGTPKVDVITPPEVAALPTHDRETGEINKEVDDDAGLVTQPASEVARAAPPTPASKPDLFQRITGAFQPRSAEPENVVAMDPKPLRDGHREGDSADDDLVIPAFLRRVPA